MRTEAKAALLVVVMLLLAACGSQTTTADQTGSGDQSVASDPSDSSTGSTPDGSAAVPAVLDFSGELLDGSSFDGATLAGKPTVLWFWAPWCPTCRAQAPAVSSLASEYAGQVNVVGVGGLADPADIRDYAETVDGPTHLVDEAGAIWRKFGVTAQSSYVVLAADGTVVADGYLDDPVLADKVAELVS